MAPKKAIIQTLSAEPPQNLCVIDILPSPANPRKAKTEEVNSLADSIKAQGLLHPIVVRPHPKKKDKYEIISGERRWRACSTFSATIPAVVRDISDEAAHEITVVENMQREDLSPIEEAAGIQTLLDSGKDAAEIADRLGKPLPWVMRRAKLHNLSPAWLTAMADNEEMRGLSASHLEIVARFDHHIQDQILEDANDLPHMTVRDLQKQCDGYMLNLSAAPWNLSEDSFPPFAGPCSSCIKRTSVQLNLFDAISDKKGKTVDRCIDRDCWKKKHAVYIEEKVKAAEKKSGSDVFLIDKSGWSGTSALDHDHPLKQKSVREYNVVITKKSDPDAKPALVIDGPGAGSTVYIKAPQKEQPVKGAEKTLTMKRQQLDDRRALKYLVYVKEILEGIRPEAIGMHDVAGLSPASLQDELTAGFSNLECWALAATFGCQQVGTGDDEKTVFDIFGETCSATLEDAKSIMMRGVYESIARHLQGLSYRNNKEFVDSLTKILSIDGDAIYQRIVEENPEPKSWAKN